MIIVIIKKIFLHVKFFKYEVETYLDILDMN